MAKLTVKTFLKDIIPENLLENVNRSFEVVGDIAIVEINQDLEKYEKEISNAIMKTNKSIKVVLKKKGIHEGEFRCQKLVHIGGENRKETLYKENGINLKLNPETVYFSARLSTERELLMNELEENKRVLVMFSGCGPYSYVAMKKQPNLARISSIEINPEGHKYAIENLQVNRNLVKKSNLFLDVKSIMKKYNLPFYEKLVIKNLNQLKYSFLNGDVKEEVKKIKLNSSSDKLNMNHNELFNQKFVDLFNFLKESEFKEIKIDFDNFKITKEFIVLFILFSEKFDFVCNIENKVYEFRSYLEKGLFLNYLEGFKIDTICKYDEIFMPLPKDAELFLDSAFEMATKNTIVHMYDFVHENEIEKKSKNAILKKAKELNKKVEIIQTRKVGQYSPRKFRVCCDFKILE